MMLVLFVQKEPNEALNFPVLLGHIITEPVWNEKKTAYPVQLVIIVHRVQQIQ